VSWPVMQSQSSVPEVLTTSVDGCKVAWRVVGDGPPAILLHGGHGSWRHWARNIESLSGIRRLLIPDMPGFGDSDDSPVADMAGYVGLLAKSIDQLPTGDGNVDLVGFSFGGLAAAHLVSHELLALRVRSLALLGPAGHGGSRRLTSDLVDWRRVSGAEALVEALRHNLATFMFAKSAEVDAEALRIHTAACQLTRFRSKVISRMGGLQKAVSSFEGPLLMAWGDADVTVTPTDIPDIIRASRPRSHTQCLNGHTRVCVVPAAGHWVQYEASQSVNELLLQFWQDTEHSPAGAGQGA